MGTRYTITKIPPRTLRLSEGALALDATVEPRRVAVLLIVHQGASILLEERVDLSKASARRRIIETLSSTRATHVSEDLLLALSGAIREAPQDVELGHEPPYLERNGILVLVQQAQHGTIEVPLTSFVGHIIGDVTEDDGVETKRAFEIEATVDGRTQRIIVPAGAYALMNWVPEQLGPRAILAPGHTLREHARAAIQSLSPNIVARRVYTHTGWRKVGQTWAFLHGDGAIGPDRVVAGVEVHLPEALAGFRLPLPSGGQDLVEAIRANLRVLDVAPDRVSCPLLAAPYRAPLGSTDFGLHLCGQTNAGKTELAALAQQHYGAEMDARHLPGSWSSTANALEGAAFAAKDAVLTVDDFAPTGSVHDAARLHGQADRLFRNQGNRAGRARMRCDGTLRPPKPPRGLILSTGEDVPRGQSLRARVLVIEVGRSDVNWDRLTGCQRDAAAGQYARVMAAYLQWLAPRYEERCAMLRRDVSEMCVQTVNRDGHRRTFHAVANLSAAWKMFLAFAQDVGAVTREEAGMLLSRGQAALAQTAESQAGHQAAGDPARQYLALLGAALAAGRAYVALRDGSVPHYGDAWGWRMVGANWHPQGERIGWLDDDGLLLEPDASHAVAQSMGARTGTPITVTGQTLRKRLDEQGLLVTTDKARGTLTVRRVVDQVRRDVIHLATDALFEVPRSTQRRSRNDSMGTTGASQNLGSDQPH